MQVGCGSPDITAGTEDDISGWLDAGRRHPGLAQFGSPADGSLAVVAGFGSTDIGADISSRSAGQKSSLYKGRCTSVTPYRIRQLPGGAAHERTTGRSYFAVRFWLLGL